MSEGDVRTPDGVETDVESSYRPPPEKTIEEILAADQEDESLRKYKEALLGQAQVCTVVIGRKTNKIIKNILNCVIFFLFFFL